MKYIRAFIKLIVILAIIYLVYFFIHDWLDKKHEEFKGNELAEQIGEPKSSGDDICIDYQTDIKEDLNFENYNTYDNIGYLIFPNYSNSKYPITLTNTRASDVDSILEYSVALDDRTLNFNEDQGNSVLYGHDYLALRYLYNIYFDENYGSDIVVKIGNNTYVYEVYEMEMISEHDSELVYSQDVKNNIITLYTCYQQNLWSPIEGRIMIKAKLVNSTNNC